MDIQELQVNIAVVNVKVDTFNMLCYLCLNDQSMEIGVSWSYLIPLSIGLGEFIHRVELEYHDGCMVSYNQSAAEIDVLLSAFMQAVYMI